MLRPYPLRAVRLVCEKAARRTIYDMGRGIRSLGVIARVSPLLGLLSLLEGTRQGLRLATLDPQGLLDTSFGWSEIFVPFAMSIVVTAVMMVCHSILTAMMERFRVETKTTTLQLMNDLFRPSTNI